MDTKAKQAKGSFRKSTLAQKPESRAKFAPPAPTENRVKREK